MAGQAKAVGQRNVRTYLATAQGPGGGIGIRSGLKIRGS
jgi:hypothetical protein